ncbi:amidase signature enzyme [Fomitiporia mediterranea MF3/22]|uniref:amidase signature enzyme n=1 Tax=Fomitiporia mediterranea (strain MF3/22) TaxID=694068 RepID=UPI00044091F0|nr:amidase signature enzyme [Fomitiporia mediterranea MF3/22]EJD07629.1 amidase signature enzyme [Fomitiporia mediterranea MF3/22]
MPSCKEVSKQKQAARAEAIARSSKRLDAEGTSTQNDSEYLAATAAEIVKHIEAGEWTALVVVSAYIRQAIRAHEATNCLTEILFEQALDEAKALDTEYASTKRLRGPLHGLPVSVKDQFDITGYDASIGYTRWANNPSVTDAHAVKVFRECGAVIIAKTNVPQTMLSFECSNPLFGRTTNPWSIDAAHTSGGSSGGEAALLAQSGSALGLGSDVGGSLRIPTSYCGVYSLKTSAGRLSCDGARSPVPGFEAITTVIGPMARSVEDVELASRVLFGASRPSFEPLPSLPYHEPILPKKLRFGYYTSDLFVKASPACSRAVMEAVEALRKAGHECIEFQPTLAREAMYLFAALTSADGYKGLLEHLGPDPKESSLFLVTLGPSLPGFVRAIAAWVARTFLHDEVFASCLESSRVKSTKEFFDTVAKRTELRKRWYEQVWENFKFDGIIAPTQAVPALPHGATTTLSPLAAGTILYNIIDSPVGIVPVTRVDPKLDALTADWAHNPEKGSGSRILEDELYRKRNAPYDPVKMAGLPVGIQVVGKSLEDEKVIAMMKIVDEALGPRDFGPSAWLRRTA